MDKRNIFYLGGAAIIAISMWLHYSYKAIKETQKAVVEQVQRLPRRVLITQPRSAPTTPPISRSPATEYLTREVLGLQQELLDENEQLELQTQTLNELKARRQENSSNDNTSASEDYNARIESTNDDIRSFIDELNTYSQLEQELQRQAETQLRDLKNQEQVLRDQLDLNIRQQQEQIAKTEADLQFWQYNFNDLTERQQRLTELESLRSQQRQQLDPIQTERQLLSTRTLERSREIQQNLTLALEEIAENRFELQREITSLRDEVQDLQNNLYRSYLQKNSLLKEIQSAQKNYEEQQQKVQTLKSRLEEKNRELSNME